MVIWIGAVISLLGVAGLGACVVLAVKAKKAGLDDDAMRVRLRQVVAYNTGALAISAIGLMCVVLGVMLG